MKKMKILREDLHGSITVADGIRSPLSILLYNIFYASYIIAVGSCVHVDGIDAGV